MTAINNINNDDNATPEMNQRAKGRWKTRIVVIDNTIFLERIVAVASKLLHRNKGECASQSYIGDPE
jgi:hypothetical protein